MIKVSKGKPGHAAGLFGSSDGKGSRTAPGHAPSSLTGADPLSVSVGQFGKGANYATPTDPPDVSLPPNAQGLTGDHPGMSVERTSVMRSRPRKGGLTDGAPPPKNPLGV